MDRMAGQAVRGVEHRHGTVVLVAFRTNGDTAMFLRMTGGAFLLGMHAWFGLQTCGNFCMAQLAAAFETSWNRDGCQRLMRIGMTIKTFCQRFS